MKYENYNEIVKLHGQCEKHKEELSRLNENLVVKIMPIHMGCSYHTIDTDAGNEGVFTPYAQELVNSIKSFLLAKIAEIEAKLETL